jgi:hypothetical protein
MRGSHRSQNLLDTWSRQCRGLLQTGENREGDLNPGGTQ